MRKEMKLTIALCCLLAIACILLAANMARAEEDYPLPPGNPDTWKIPGQTDTFAPPEPPMPSNTFSAPPPPGNVGLEQPSVPAGQAEEKYTGTRDFGPIGGTGIGQFGPDENR